MLPTAFPDGERILAWEQVYDLTGAAGHIDRRRPGVTGAEFASAYNSLSADVVLVSSRDRVLPGEDAQAATVLEDVLTRRGMAVLSRRRASGATREAMQGGIAMWHALGDAVKPPNLNSVSANVFTAPEIATVGWSQDAVTAVTPTRAEAARRLHTRPEHGR